MQNRYLHGVLQKRHKEQQREIVTPCPQQNEQGAFKLMYLTLLLGLAAYLLWKFVETPTEAAFEELGEGDFILSCERTPKGMRCTPSFAQVIDGVRSLVPDNRTIIKFSREQTYYLIRASTFVEQHQTACGQNEMKGPRL